MMTNKGKWIAGIVAGLFATWAPVVAHAEGKKDDVKCEGINSCKGTGACGSATNACAGKNACKGKGWVHATAKECKEKGGKVLAETEPKDKAGKK